MSVMNVADRGKRIVGLDLLRGTAIALVLLRHAWPDVFGGAGIVGVLIFFVLSGYLITRLLLNDLVRFGRIRFGIFYRNRALRLIPPLIVFLVGLTVVSLCFDPLSDRSELGRALIFAVTYTANIPVNLGSPAIAHLWTLATEEQFYLIWPLFLAAAWRRRAFKVLFAVAISLNLVAIALSLVIVVPDFSKIYGVFTSWSLALVAGAGLAVIERQSRRDAQRRVRRPILAAAIALLLVAAIMPEPKAYWWGYAVFGPLVAFAASVLVWRARNTTNLSPTLGPMLWLGKISYAAYLWSYPVKLWLDEWAPSIAGPLSIALTLVLAQLSWTLVESPVASWRRRIDARSALRSTGAESSTNGATPAPATESE